MKNAKIASELVKLAKELMAALPPLTVKNYSNNGAMTKAILQACKTHAEEPDAIRNFVLQVLRQARSMSSEKVIYDQDLSSMPSAVKKAVLSAAEESDKGKWQSAFDQAKSMGADDKRAKGIAGKSFGRYKA